MAIEEHEFTETNLDELIERLEQDDIPTNIFTVEDKDPMVILGKLNEVIANLQSINNTVSSSDAKAGEALTKATQAIADATQALTTANGIDAKATLALQNAVDAVESANSAIQASTQALTSANTALTTANTAISTANSAEETAQSAETKADTAISTANTASATATSAKNTAEGIDAKATTALSNSQTAVSTANSANATAQEALEQVIAGQGTKVYRDTQLLTSLDIKPIEDDIANNATAINNEATTRANAVNALDIAKVDKVTGKQLSTEDFTTEEKTKLAGLYNYNDTEVKADISALQNGKVDKVTGKQLSTEDFTTTEKNKLAGLSNYDDTQVQADIAALQTRATNIETKNTEQDTAIANAQSTAENALNVANGAVKTTDLLNKVYPVGAIYMSVNDTTPASFLGGTWEQLEDRFLLGCGNTYVPGFTGGEATHKLTIKEMPSHRHRVYSSSGYSGDSIGLGNSNGKYMACTLNGGNAGYYDTTKTGSNALENTGGGQAHNNMPPYLVVFMWKRTA